MEKRNRLKIAYYTLLDPKDKRSWSGITYYLGKSLQNNIGEVDFLGPVKIPWILSKTLFGLHVLNKKVFRTIWAPNYSLIKSLYAVRCLKKRMKGKKYDILIAASAASELAYLKTKVPIVYFGDATFKGYTGTYDEFKDLSSFSKWEGNHLEQKSLNKSSLVVLTSNWAAQSAFADYKVPKEKVEVMLMGANMDDVPDRSVIYKKLSNPVLTLLFLGVDWERKGGAIAFETLKNLHAMGIKARLIVCGVQPPAGFQDTDMEVIPFLNKNDGLQHQRFVQILSSTHFLLMPTRADCSLLVNNEANAFGVPTISTNVGGVADVVNDGVNGYCLPLEADAGAYARLISDVFSDQNRYQALIESSRERFENVLNWDSFTRQLASAIERHQLCGAEASC